MYRYDIYTHTRICGFYDENNVIPFAVSSIAGVRTLLAESVIAISSLDV